MEPLSAAEKGLADFIAVRESEGNYDAYIGHIHGAPGAVTGLTVQNAYVFQRQLIDDGEPSTAIGKYQTLQRTLSACVQALGIPLTAMLTPECQDEIAGHLLSGRGYELWQAGDIDDNEFMHRLSCEWASLPDPYNDGKSHYDGDSAGNHAGRTLDEFQTAITVCRAQQQNAQGA